MTRAVLFWASIVALAGCAPKVPESARHDLIVASVPPLAILVRELVPEDVEVRSLVPYGASPHVFDLPPSGAALLERAKLVIRVGPGFDDFAAASGKTWDYLAAIDGVGSANGHFWTDPEAVLDILPSLGRSLRERFPSKQTLISERETAFAEAIRARLKLWNERTAPLSDRSVVLFHDVFEPFCRRFGIKVAGLVEPKPGVEPSLSELISLARRAQTQKPRVVVSEPQLPEAPAEVIAEELGVRVVQIDPYGGREQGGYVEFMDGLIARFEEALR
jgi:ABC-type Zn uptake system ZnuABC Zn-binding protein ZnuA